MDIFRYRTAISRSELSKPVRLALLSGIINTETTIFDYGCGRGTDIKFLNAQGIKTLGTIVIIFRKRISFSRI